MAAREKRVLVLYGGSKRVLTLSPRSAGDPTEREAVVRQAKQMFHLPPGARVVLQLRDEEWGGEFVDYVREEIQDKAVYRLALLQEPIAMYQVRKLASYMI